MPVIVFLSDVHRVDCAATLEIENYGSAELILVTNRCRNPAQILTYRDGNERRTQGGAPPRPAIASTPPTTTLEYNYATDGGWKSRGECLQRCHIE